MQTTQAVTDNVAGKRSIQQKEFDGISNAAVVQIISGLTCIGLQVKSNTCGIRPSAAECCSTNRVAYLCI